MTPRQREDRPRWWRRIWQQYPCTRCGAAPGQPCTTDSGRRMHEPHSDRAVRAREDGWRLLDDE